MSLLPVFDTIVDIMHHDYAGFENKKGWDRPDLFREQLIQLEQNNQLTRLVFEDILNKYLLDFQDDHNAIRSVKQDALPQTVGFRVKHYEDHLYVEKVNQETRLKKGTVISKVDRIPINLVADENRRLLKTSEAEREWWEMLLLKASEVTIDDGESEKAFDLEHYDDPRQPSHYEYEKKDHISIFRFNDFIDLDQMHKLLEQHQQEIEASTQWIIDVRECRGGSDSVYEPLLNGIFQPIPVIKEDGMVHLVTERNYKNRLQSFKKFNVDHDPFIETFKKQMEMNIGKGFVTFDFSEYEDDLSFTGSTIPTQVIVLTDKFCGSSGEQFVLTARQSTKVTIIGRPTRGVLDYSNQAVEHFEDEGYDFLYATSRSDRVERGEGIDVKGITPDHYIKWTPEHLKRDVDLDYALNLLKVQQ